jgi:phosphate transport system substrate-binding protein
MRKRTVRARACGVAAVMGIVAISASSAGAVGSHALIQGSGSSWSSNAVNQWIADVQTSGLQVVFTANGSAQGRKDFGYRTTDFGVTDIGYQGVDPVTGDQDTAQGREFAYLPVVAGGTAFPYQVRVGGQLVRNIRLSGATLAGIFTNHITNWNDAAITKDNNGRKLPSLPIIAVVHSEGSGSTAQFTRYLDTVYSSVWRPFLGQAGLTEYFPRKGPQIAQNGSDGVMNFISSAAANGAIGYDEYSYALSKNYPVAKVLNSSGYYTLPNQYNVAVALTQAQINQDKTSPNYLLQNLDNVYTYGDVRTYPLSSYSYTIIPTAANDTKMTTAKRQTLADFLYYSVCEGQREMGPIGYSPLPLNLVQASFDQTAKLKTADAGVNLSSQKVTACNNPTFDPKHPTSNFLAEIAPKPQACDKTGQGPCSGTVDIGIANPVGNSAPGSAGVGGTSAPSNGAVVPLAANPGATPKAGAKSSAAAQTHIDPATGQVVSDIGGTSGGADAIGVPTDLAAYHSGSTMQYSIFAVVLLMLALLAPPLVARRLASRARGRVR